MEKMEARNQEYVISTSIDKLDRKLIYNFLCKDSGWSNGISFETVNKSIDGFHNESQGPSKFETLDIADKYCGMAI